MSKTAREPRLVSSKVSRGGSLRLTFLTELKPRQYLTVTCVVNEIRWGPTRQVVISSTVTRKRKIMKHLAEGYVTLSLHHAVVSNRRPKP